MFNDNNLVYGDQNVQVPAHLNFGKFILDRIRKKRNEIALESAVTGDHMTYNDVHEYSVGLAVGLLNLGVGNNDVVAVASEKRVDFIPTVLAVVFTGATYTPYDLKSGRAVLKHKLSISKPSYLICSKLFWDKYKEVIKATECIKQVITLDDIEEASVLNVNKLIDGDIDASKFEPAFVNGQTDTVFILYSSGTTGMPKGVQLTHLNCIINSLPDDFKDDSLKTALIFGEWYHNYDTFMTYKFLALGRTIYYLHDGSIEEILQSIGKCQINIAFMVPSVVNLLSKVADIEKYNVDSLKIIYSRSSPLHEKIMAIVKHKFPKLRSILQGYGMTEAGELTSETWGIKGPKAGSVGMASPGITLKVVDPETNKTLAPGQRGEIRLRGPVFMKGYIGVDPSSYLDPYGFFQTGDLGYHDEDGYFFIVERLKEIFAYDGYKIAPLELETILQLHPGVKECGVVGKPVPIVGEEPTAFVVRTPGSHVTEEELQEFVAKEVSPFMKLRGGVIFVDEIPRNPRGKLLRSALRDMLRRQTEDKEE